jgi:uncharacterized membrane protein
MEASALFRVIGDALCIISLALICSTSLTAWNKMPKDAKIPMQWNTKGEPTWRAGKTVGLLFVPIMATVILFVPTILGTTRTAVEPVQILIVFAMRSIAAAVFCVANLYFLKAAYKALEDEGKM